MALPVGHASDGCQLDFSEVIGLRVDVEDSQNCGGGNSAAQTVTNSAKVKTQNVRW